MLPSGDELKCDFSGLFFEHFVGEGEKAHDDLDDMVWFVRERGLIEGNPAETKGAEDDVIYILRRTAQETFPPVRCPSIDWRATLYLNIITQWSYTLTVGVCRSHVDGRKDLVALSWVQRKVFAQPSSPESLDKTGIHRYTFPKVYFTVDDFDEAFGSILLEQGHGWCVELVADNGSARIPVFRGAVPHHKMIKMFKATSQRGILPVFRSREEIINMKGPGGRGSAKASVSVLEGKNLKESDTLRCALVNISASWFDIAYALEHPVAAEWMHVPTEAELAEEVRLNEELCLARKRAEELNRIADEDEKGASALHRASISAKAARTSASKFFDEVKGGFLSRASELLNRDKKDAEDSPASKPTSPASPASPGSPGAPVLPASPPQTEEAPS
eukprot:TRINITY_DN12292_c0_g1_i5.p1 TRINITY_DN12292_c0_g1~~TRINITY_DN12292_c0_g1_i5.p1  ORF type:complete len:390 (+),score=134.22 TRINITY_DN12292_c0_g1_i5:91-1260(+)